MRLLVLLLAVGSLGLAVDASSALAAKAPPTPTQEYAQATKLLGKIRSSTFSHGRRAGLLGSARRGTRVVRGRQACRALSTIDHLLGLLRNTASWKRHKIPRSAREPQRLLGLAEKSVLRTAGRSCALPMATKRPVPVQGGDMTKVPPPDGITENDQGGDSAKALPAGRLRVPKSIGAGAGLGGDPYEPGLSPSGDPLARPAADPLTFFRSTDAGTPTRSATPMEPASAIGGHVVWYTGNTSDSFSTNDGRTFQELDPSTVLPDNGLSYCCDQVVAYSRYYHIFVWVSQYWCATSCMKPDGKGGTRCPTGTETNGSNRIRISVARPEDLIKFAANPGQAWHSWDFTPQAFGQPANAWFDRSDLSLNSRSANLTVDVICGNTSSVLGRFSLAALDSAIVGGSPSFSYITDTAQRMAIAQGDNTTTTYFVGNNSASQARIWSWDAFSDTLFRHDIDHSSIPQLNSAVPGSDGKDWYSRFGIFPGAVETATLSGNTLYVGQGTGRDLCTDQCGPGQTPTIKHLFDRPAIFVSRFDVNSWKNVGERWLWNSTLAFGWPAMQTDAAGDVGIVFRSSDTSHNAQPVAGFLTPAEQFTFALPEGQPHITGDYYSLRTGRTSTSFAMTAQNVQDDPGAPGTMHWYYIEYGHGPSPYVSPPSVHITAPPDLSQLSQGDRVGYSASATDPVDGTLPGQAVVWTEDGTLIGRGATITHVEDAPGSHVIKVTATNGDGKSASDQITIRVQGTPPPPGAPTVTITQPFDQAHFNGPYVDDPTFFCVNVSFSATATGGAGPLSYTWTDSVNGAGATQVSTQLSPTLKLCDGTTFNTSTPHDLTLRVSDGSNTAVATVRVFIDSPRLG